MADDVTNGDQPQPVAISISLDANDVKAFSGFLNRRWRRSLGPRRIGIGLLAAAAMGGSLAFAVSGWALGLFLAGAVAVELWKKSARALRIEEVRVSLGGQMIADVDGLVVHQRGWVTRVDWPGFRDLTVTDQHIFLTVTSFSGYIVPKRCFDDSDQMHRFVAFARAGRRAWPPPTDTAR